MKLIHISDLHIGRRVRGFSLIEDQKHILSQIIEVAKKEDIQGIIIAGDIYDTSIPTAEAVSVFDEFISILHSLKINCYIVSGNHDNVHRVSFGSQIMANEGIHFAKKYSGELEPIEIEKDVYIWLLPFIRPFEVRDFHSDFACGSYDEMMKAVIETSNVDTTKTNILVAHQFVTCNGKDPERSESETTSLGTMDNVDVSNFEKFDYVALGHIHKPQPMGKQTVRYSGSPLKYSFSEKNDKKSMIVLDIKPKDIKFDFIEFKPLRDMVEVVGTFDEITKLKPTKDYARIVLKDEDYILDVKKKLEPIFENVMEIVYDNTYTHSNNYEDLNINDEKISPLELFKIFYEKQNNKEMSDSQIEIISEIFKDLDMEENV